MQACDSLLLAAVQAGLALHHSPLRAVMAPPARPRHAGQGNATAAEAALGQQTCKRKHPRGSHISLGHTPAPTGARGW